MSRAPRGRLLGSLAASAVAMTLAAGCSAPHHGRGPLTSGVQHAIHLVAWDASVPEELHPYEGRPAVPCRADQLRVVGAGFLFAPGASGGTGTVTLRNAGRTPCRLTGRPQVRLVGAPRQPPQRQVDLPPQPAPFPQVVPPDPALRALSHGATATLSVDWRNWCVPGAGRTPKPVVPPRAVRVTLSGGLGSLDVGYNAVPGCDAPDRPSTVGVRPFQPAPLHTRPWTSAALRATIASLPGAPSRLTGRRGQVVRFAVTLQNASRDVARFDNCPMVIEALEPAGRPEVHQLNCRAAAPITPGNSLAFEMRIRVPRNAPLGNNGLFWELDPTGAEGPQVVSGLEVLG